MEGKLELSQVKPPHRHPSVARRRATPRYPTLALRVLLHLVPAGARLLRVTFYRTFPSPGYSQRYPHSARSFRLPSARWRPSALALSSRARKCAYVRRFSLTVRLCGFTTTTAITRFYRYLRQRVSPTQRQREIGVYVPRVYVYTRRARDDESTLDKDAHRARRGCDEGASGGSEKDKARKRETRERGKRERAREGRRRSQQPLTRQYYFQPFSGANATTRHAEQSVGPSDRNQREYIDGGTLFP